jgi:hypothetical protein
VECGLHSEAEYIFATTSSSVGDDTRTSFEGSAEIAPTAIANGLTRAEGRYMPWTSPPKASAPCFQATAQQSPTALATGAHQTATERDGQHNFDFHIGSWKTHVSRRLAQEAVALEPATSDSGTKSADVQPEKRQEGDSCFSHTLGP